MKLDLTLSTISQIREALLYTADLQENLFALARSLRNQRHASEVYPRGVIEFSNHCELNCNYCGMRKQNKNLARYRLAKLEVLNAARLIESLGVQSIMLQSGDDYSYPIIDLVEIIYLIKAETTLHIILCLGERKYSDMEKIRIAGADMYILKLETLNRNLFRKLRPGKTFDQRLKLLLFLKEIGYEISSGFIVGLPGQSIQELAEGALLLKEIGVHAASVSPFIPNDSSPLAGFPPGDLETTYNMIAVLRILLGNVLIPSVSALSMLNPEGQVRGFNAGANVITINFTPKAYTKDYLIYDSHRFIVTLKTAIETIEKAGLRSSLKDIDNIERGCSSVIHQKEELYV